MKFVFLVLSLLLANLVQGGCGKSGKAWPDKPLVEKRGTVQGVAFAVQVPKGVGSFHDGNVYIYRDVSPSFAFFVKITTEEVLPDLNGLREELKGSKETSLKALTHDAVSVEMILKEAPNSRYTVHRWVKKGGRVLKCEAILGRKIGDAAQVAKCNAWVLRMCRSLKHSS